ncbi:hypothetical protein ACLMNJ_37470 [Streptomyces seoulensis]
MSLDRELRHLLVRAQGEASPLYTAEDPASEDLARFTHNISLSDAELGLPEWLADRLASWSRTRPPEGFASRADSRPYVNQGLEAARTLARHLGPLWVVRYWDEGHETAKFVCWGCDRLHWALDFHSTPPHPLNITVLGEYKWYPLRAEGFGDFGPDDAAAGLGLSDELVADLYAWAADFNTGMDLYLKDRDDEADDARREELDRRGRTLTERLARELAPGRTVTYGGLA